MDEAERGAEDVRREGGPAGRRRQFEQERGVHDDEAPPPRPPADDETGAGADEGGDG